MENRMKQLATIALEPILGLSYNLPGYLKLLKDIGGESDFGKLAFYHLHASVEANDELLDMETIEKSMECQGGVCAGYFHSSRLLAQKEKIPGKLKDFDLIFPGTILWGLGNNYWIPKLVPFGDSDECWKQSWHPIKTGIGSHSLVVHVPS